MSSMKNETISCPNCSNKLKVEVWNSINVTLDSTLKEKLFNGRLNISRCPFCNYETVIETPLLYHDMDKKIAIQYYPFSFLENKNFVQSLIENAQKTKGILESGPINIPKYIINPHVVFSIEEMCRYIVYKETISINNIYI